MQRKDSGVLESFGGLRDLEGSTEKDSYDQSPYVAAKVVKRCTTCGAQHARL